MDSLDPRPTGVNILSRPRPSLIAAYRRKTISRFADWNADNRANSFATQYTGLILIVFTVIIGSLSAAQLDQQTEYQTSKKTPPLARVSLPRLFEGGAINPDSEQLAVLKELLNHHDIRGQLILPFTEKSPTLGFKRIVALRTQTKQHGIPSSYLVLQLDEQHAEPPLLIIEHAQ
jgi:hypothetical protein